VAVVEVERIIIGVVVVVDELVVDEGDVVDV
jgi:hypothetical protein